MIEAAALAEALEGAGEVAQNATELGGNPLKFDDFSVPDINSPESPIRSDFPDSFQKSSDLSIKGDFVCPETISEGLTEQPDYFPEQDIQVPDIDSPDVQGIVESAGENVFEIEDGPKRIKCINEKYAGMNHPETGVPYEEKVVIDSDGNEVVGVFPQFESVMDVQLPDDLLLASDDKQFAECGRKLKEKCLSDPEFASQFNERQLDDIMNERTPPYGYVWHHNEEIGKMQLVDYDTHADTRHTGGKAIWGGGREYR